MNESDRKTYVGYRLATSKEFLADARALVGMGSLKSAANRIYYSMFQAVSALALCEGFETKSHTQLMGWFNKSHVRTGTISSSLGSAYGRAFDLRSDCDYKDMPSFSSEELTELASQADDLIKTAEEIIKRRFAI
ncbi:MAG: HEPN domain-containing protein [Lentisphaerota bacterium]